MIKRTMRGSLWLVSLVLVLCIVFSGCQILDSEIDIYDGTGQTTASATKPTDKPSDLGNGGSEGQNSFVGSDVGEQREAEKALGVPKFSKDAFVALNGNTPTFADKEITSVSYELYSELDYLGRCGYAVACIGKDIMPTEERESISSVKPSGWVNNKYDTELIDGGYVYNRCHLIGFQLTGENANKQNLITGTRYMNVEGMLPFENMVADYVKETGNHVMYRVTPIYDRSDLVCCGVQMEAFSVEDEGEGICFNVYAYNVQPGIVIDYATGDNWLYGSSSENQQSTQKGENEYILNTKTKKIHLPSCHGVSSMSEANKGSYRGDIQRLLEDGYTACGICKPNT